VRPWPSVRRSSSRTGSMCPVNRAMTSWNNQPLPSGSLTEAYER
jgi:hypothetical protein